MSNRIQKSLDNEVEIVEWRGEISCIWTNFFIGFLFKRREFGRSCPFMHFARVRHKFSCIMFVFHVQRSPNKMVLGFLERACSDVECQKECSRVHFTTRHETAKIKSVLCFTRAKHQRVPWFDDAPWTRTTDLSRPMRSLFPLCYERQTAANWFSISS